MFESYLFFCPAAYFNDIAVGAVCCRVDHSQNQKRLYIMTLGCLAPYRRLGIGKQLHMSGRRCSATLDLVFCFSSFDSVFFSRYEDAESCAKHLWEGWHFWQHLPVSVWL